MVVLRGVERFFDGGSRSLLVAAFLDLLAVNNLFVHTEHLVVGDDRLEVPVVVFHRGLLPQLVRQLAVQGCSRRQALRGVNILKRAAIADRQRTRSEVNRIVGVYQRPAPHKLWEERLLVQPVVTLGGVKYQSGPLLGTKKGPPRY